MNVIESCARLKAVIGGVAATTTKAAPKYQTGKELAKADAKDPVSRRNFKIHGKIAGKFDWT